VRGQRSEVRGPRSERFNEGVGVGRIEKFEDINAWQEARNLVEMIYKLTQSRNFANDYRLRDQIRSAAVSVMSNIAEGFDSQSDIEFIKFLVYARRSASETQSHLYVALDAGYLERSEFDVFYDKTVEVKGLVGGFIRYLRQKRAENNDIRHRT